MIPVGMITGFVGGVMQSIAARKAQEKMFKEYEKERARQEAFAGQATGVFKGRLGTADVETAKAQMQAGAQKRLADFSAIAQQNLAPTAMLALTPQDRAALAATTKSRARLGSYSDWALQQAIQDIRTQQDINRVVQEAGGQASIFPYRQYSAEHSYDWLSNLGQLISSAGGAAGTFANMRQAPQYYNPYMMQGNPELEEEDWSRR